MFISTKEAASLLGVSLHTIYRMIERGDIKVYPCKGRYRIPKSQFEKMTEATKK